MFWIFPWALLHLKFVFSECIFSKGNLSLMLVFYSWFTTILPQTCVTKNYVFIGENITCKVLCFQRFEKCNDNSRGYYYRICVFYQYIWMYLMSLILLFINLILWNPPVFWKFNDTLNISVIGIKCCNEWYIYLFKYFFGLHKSFYGMERVF